MNTVTPRLTAALIALTLTQVGCASLNRTEEGAIIGTAAGAAAGAAVGNATGSTSRGAIIGAVLGGTAGAVIGRRMDNKAEELEAQLADAEVERVGEGILITFDSGILFGFDSSDLSPAARGNLNSLAAALDDVEQDATLMIVGHTDAQGTDAYNQRLSERRAEAAAAYLRAQGVAPANLRTIGMGESEPVASNETDAGRADNRRVEVAIYASEEYREAVRSRVGG